MTITLPTAPCVIDQGTVIEDFTNLAAWTADSSMNALARHYRCVDQANKGGIVLSQRTTSVAQGFATRTGLSLDLSAMQTIRLDLCLPMVGQALYSGSSARLTIEFSSTGDFSTKKMSSGLSNWPKHGYSRLTVGVGEFTATGGESFANPMVAMRVGLTCSNYGDGSTCWTACPYVLLDKIVMNAQQKPLLCIGIDTELSAGLAAFLAALDSYGLRTHAFTAAIDYDNVGDATHSTWAEIQAAVAGGLYCVPEYTSWLLASPAAAVRPVPPYPAQDTSDYPDASDSTYLNRIGLNNSETVWQRVKAIHDFYGLPWNPDLALCHNGYGDDYENRYLWQSRGVKMQSAQPGNYSATYPDEQWYHSLPPLMGIDPVDTYGMNLNASTTLAQLKSVLDRAVLYGRQLFCFFSNTSQWTDDDFRAFLAYAVAYQQAGQLLIVNPAEFAAQVGITASISRTIPLTSGDGQNFSMTAGEHVMVTFTTDTPFDEVTSAEWVARPASWRMASQVSITKTTAITLSADTDGSAVATVELLLADTEALDGSFIWQLWLYDSAGDGVDAASGSLTVSQSLV